MDCAAERTYTELEKLLIQFGFTEMFGIGLFAVSEKSVVADTNSGMVKLIPHLDASADDFFGFYDESEIEQLELKLEALKATGFIS
jgi:hypothetical protein